VSDDAREFAPEYMVIHMPWPWPHGWTTRTLVIPVGSPPPPGTGWEVLFRGSGYACTVFLEQSFGEGGEDG